MGNSPVRDGGSQMERVRPEGLRGYQVPVSVGGSQMERVRLEGLRGCQVGRTLKAL